MGADVQPGGCARVDRHPPVHLTPVLTATGPGTVQVDGQHVSWRVTVDAGASARLHIRAQAGPTPGGATNQAVFSSTHVLTRSAPVLVYGAQVYLPLVLRE